MVQDAEGNWIRKAPWTCKGTVRIDPADPTWAYGRCLDCSKGIDCGGEVTEEGWIDEDDWADGLGCDNADGDSSQDQEGKGEELLVN